MERGLGEAAPRNSRDAGVGGADARPLRGGNRIGARREDQQLSEVPAVQGQLHHRPLADDAAQLGRRRLEQCRLRGDHDRVGDGADVQHHVLVQRLVYGNVKRGNLRRLEARLFHGENIGPRQHVNEQEIPALVGLDLGHNLGALVGQLDRGAGDSPTGPISNGTVYLASRHLRPKHWSREHDAQEHCHCRTSYIHPFLPLLRLCRSTLNANAKLEYTLPTRPFQALFQRNPLKLTVKVRGKWGHFDFGATWNDHMAS